MKVIKYRGCPINLIEIRVDTGYVVLYGRTQYNIVESCNDIRDLEYDMYEFFIRYPAVTSESSSLFSPRVPTISTMSFDFVENFY